MRPVSVAFLASSVLARGLQHADAGAVEVLAANADEADRSSAVPTRQGVIMNGNHSTDFISVHRRATKDELKKLNQYEIYAWLRNMDLRTDCFFVTVARLLGYTTSEALQAAGVPAPPRGISHGVTLAQMYLAMDRLGVRLRLLTFQGYTELNSAGPQRTANLRCAPTMYRQRWSTTPPRTMGVAFRRRGGSSHIAIVRNAGRGPLTQYLDYQSNPFGQDISADVESSNICFYFYIDLDTSTGTFISGRRRPIREMNRQAAIDASSARLPAAATQPQQPAPTAQRTQSDPLEAPATDNHEVLVEDITDRLSRIHLSEGDAGNSANTVDDFDDISDDISDLSDSNEESTRDEPDGSKTAVAAGPSVLIPSGALDLATIGPNTIDSIFSNQLTSNECAQFLASEAIFLRTSGAARPSPNESNHERRDNGPRKSECLKLQAAVARSSPCRKIRSLEIGIVIPFEDDAGTYDFILATIGNSTIRLGFNEMRGYKAWKPVDLKAAFGSDTVDIRSIQKMYLLAQGEKGAIWFFRNDWWKVQGIAFRAKCETPGFLLRNDRLMTLNRWYQHPAATQKGILPYEPATVAKFYISTSDWYMTPCAFIKELQFEFQISYVPASGSYDSLSLAFQDGKNSTFLMQSFSRGARKLDTVDLAANFGRRIVDLRQITKMSLRDRFASEKKTDWWRFSSACFPCRPQTSPFDGCS
ncbi:hypothetical protein DCS_04419 [Drechmeria coniospora]|uniref:Uncharacterized protein n=1 Tax=Drechmeria coniospora TaxID=98403 RepID=A0A151GJY0_DRECN|nr:hypothetical protein DCS_04419 [Drechmeria coniospora]KYK57410.1 hypothetical protein DCS_04419 [Drechmeria coniospora]